LRHSLLCSLLFMLICTTSHAQRELWGSSMAGGDYANGFIFRSDSIGDNVQIVHHFKSAVDCENISALTLASNNKLYGLAASGGLGSTGVYSGGTLFEYDLATDQFNVLVTFGPNLNQLPSNPTTPRAEGKPVLTEIRPGVLYGLLRQGSYVFSYNIDTGELARPFILPTYTGDAMNGTLQNKLNTGFYKLGNFWYTTTSTNSECPIGNPYSGSVMRMDANGNGISVVLRAHCLASDGVTYDGSFTEVNGKFYGTTAYGGTANSGVIYEYNPAISTTLAYTKLYDFVGYPYSYQVQSLVSAGNGKLYGAAHGGGASEQNSPAGCGILFEFDIATNTFTKKYNFTLIGQSIYDLGAFPSGLIKGANNKLYGATQYGVFEYNPTDGAMRTAGRFNGVGFAPSLVSVCRKPAYTPREQATFYVCDGEPFSLDIGSTNTTTAVWTHDGVVDDKQTSTTLQFQAFTIAHNGNWVCTMTNECGTTVSQTYSLEYSTPGKPSITADGPVEFCAGNSVTLSASAALGGYRWSTGATTQEITVLESGSYTVSANNGCESPASDAVTVTAYALPAAPTIMVDEAGTKLTASGGSGVYQWMLDNIPLETDAATITATVSGTYKVYSISAENCISTDFASRQIVVKPVVTGIEDASNQALKVYPNPSRGVFQLRVNNTLLGPASVSVVSAQGNVVHTQTLTLTKDPTTMSLDHLPAGLYSLVIKKGAAVVVKKIVIR
jgi:uncharacterized repeat protein (TIGR03803 family)